VQALLYFSAPHALRERRSNENDGVLPVTHQPKNTGQQVKAACERLKQAVAAAAGIERQRLSQTPGPLSGGRQYPCSALSMCKGGRLLSAYADNRAAIAARDDTSSLIKIRRRCEAPVHELISKIEARVLFGVSCLVLYW
jgi:hypothetical protein